MPDSLPPPTPYPLRERHVDIGYGSITAACLLVLAGLIALIAWRPGDWNVGTWIIAIGGLLVVSVMLVSALKGARYEVVVDHSGVRRSGPGGGDVPWSALVDVAELPTRQRHLGLVNTCGLAGLRGESAMARTYGLPDGTVVVHVGPSLRRAIESHLGRPARPIAKSRRARTST
ncbi:hypothetical protein [Nocardioides sp. GXZ039]|uniref:hypothetical protein n=1 Tax=Nocardioides sp. GXZ039 TaxID=3136018 RepID=UPI0030F3B8DA